MITFKFSQEEICHGTNITINVVQKCPENAKTVQMRIIERKCYQYPKCDGEVLVYHCISQQPHRSMFSEWINNRLTWHT